MNIVDAYNSGRRVRLLYTIDKNLHDWFDPTEKDFVIDRNEIVSNEWEVEERQAVFTESELVTGFASGMRDLQYSGLSFNEAAKRIVDDIFERKIKGSITE